MNNQPPVRMLAARDQENFVHAHQTIAASKPLNQGLRHLQQKTPAKVRVPLNDENGPLPLGGKNTVKKNDTVMRLKDGGDKATVTPIGMTSGL